MYFFFISFCFPEENFKPAERSGDHRLASLKRTGWDADAASPGREQKAYPRTDRLYRREWRKQLGES
jgi:hypothetical protein